MVKQFVLLGFLGLVAAVKFNPQEIEATYAADRDATLAGGLELPDPHTKAVAGPPNAPISSGIAEVANEAADAMPLERKDKPAFAQHDEPSKKFASTRSVAGKYFE